MAAPTLADAAAEMIERRRENNASGPYLADLRSRAGRFCKMFAVHPASVTTADCQRYLDSLKTSSATKNADRQVLLRLFAHCESRGYIARGANPMAETERYNGQHGDAVEVWTPAEMARLLSHAAPDFLPVLCIGAFVLIQI